MNKPSRHVYRSLSGRWAVRRFGAFRASRLFETQHDAVKYARQVARKEGSDLYVHAFDGTVRQRECYGPVPTAAR